jgi:hypothetical protein
MRNCSWRRLWSNTDCTPASHVGGGAWRGPGGRVPPPDASPSVILGRALRPSTASCCSASLSASTGVSTRARDAANGAEGTAARMGGGRKAPRTERSASASPPEALLIAAISRRRASAAVRNAARSDRAVESHRTDASSLRRTARGDGAAGRAERSPPQNRATDISVEESRMFIKAPSTSTAPGPGPTKCSCRSRTRRSGRSARADRPP